MKLLKLLIFSACIFFNLCQSFNSQVYKNGGKDWPGLCNTGSHQSPINIIIDSNTENTNNYVEFDYSIPPGGENKKLFYDGDKLYMDINLGTITYNNFAGAKETYTANKIEFHFPAEHYITKDHQTPRYALEMQIFHTLKLSDNSKATNKQIQVNQAIVSILFTIGDAEEPDVFLNEMGISQYNINDHGKYNIPKPNSNLSRGKSITASYDIGLNYMAFHGLLNILNMNSHLLFYYGSETSPPCKEDVLWMVYAVPRSINKAQFDFLLLMLANHKDGKDVSDAEVPEDLYGNNRSLILYDDNLRGSILSNKVGIKHVKRRSYFRPADSDN